MTTDTVNHAQPTRGLPVNPFKILRSENGITVAELKALVKDLPETDKNGDPYGVWIGNKESASNAALEICPLNQGDILIEY